MKSEIFNLTHRILDYEHFPILRPAADGRVARFDHAIRLLEEDWDGAGIAGSRLVLLRAIRGTTPDVLGRLLIAGRGRVVAGIVVVLGVVIAALIAAFRHSAESVLLLALL